MSVGSSEARAELGADDLDAGEESASHRVAAAIIRGIRAGNFVPGQHLLESELTRKLNISRGSLREALKHLAATGIVTLNRFRGAYIAALDRKSVLDLLDTLEPLARLGARLAASNCQTDADRQSIRHAVEAIDIARKRGSRATYLEERRNFYKVMLDLAGNRELARVIPLARTDVFRAQVESVQSEKQRSRHASGYSAIGHAIIAGDPAAADRAMRKHYEATRKTMAELPDSAFAGEESE